MKFGASRSQLYDAQKTARVKYEHVCTDWNDEAQKQFEEEIWEPLDRHVSDLLRAVDRLSVEFAQIRAECEFRDDM